LEKIKRNIQLASLGLCEHCGELLTMQDLPVEAINAVWKCPKCKGILTYKSFGYEQIKGKWQKTRWVGEDGKWTETKPTAGFVLGSWFITDAIAAPIF